MSDWGEGALNNNIGWGQGFNNTISWGSVYGVSYAGQTIISQVINIEDIINNFKTRVSDDGGTFEAESFLRSTLTGLADESNLANSFKLRVSNDGGLFEAESFLLSTLTNLNSN
tara:strand:+ start:359 stop:700 length:342 start_codon:yes stop_codon:yes gene_type:complete